MDDVTAILKRRVVSEPQDGLSEALSRRLSLALVVVTILSLAALWALGRVPLYVTEPVAFVPVCCSTGAEETSGLLVWMNQRLVWMSPRLGWVDLQQPGVDQCARLPVEATHWPRRGQPLRLDVTAACSMQLKLPPNEVSLQASFRHPEGTLLTSVAFEIRRMFRQISH